jgi:phosphate-selective porin OprO and OprP
MSRRQIHLVVCVGWVASIIGCVGRVAEAQVLPSQGESLARVPAINWQESNRDGVGKTDSTASDSSDWERELDARLSRLEALTAELHTTQDSSALESVVPEPESEQPTFEYGGRIHFDQLHFLHDQPGIGFLENPDPSLPGFGDDPEDTVYFRRIRLELEGDIPQDMVWRMQIDFNNPANAEYKDVYFGWEKLPGNHTFLIGNQKRPLGLDHLNSSRFNVFIERPLVVESFNEDARRIGGSLYGYRDDESANWQLGLYNLENTSTDGRFIGDSLQLGGYGRFAASPWFDERAGGSRYFHWALAGAVAKPDGDASAADSNFNEARFRTRPMARSQSRWLNTGRIAGAEWFETIGVEAMLNVGRLQVTSEYMASFVQRDEHTAPQTGDLFFHGCYVYAAYFLTGEHMAYDRRSSTLDRAIPIQNFSWLDRLRGEPDAGWGAWQIAARYDYLDLTDRDIRGGVGHGYTLGLNWYWNAYAKVQSNLIFGDISQREPIAGFDGGDFTLINLRYMADF